MSSRQGISDSEVAGNLLQAVRETVVRQFPEASQEAQQAVYLAAVKYTFLKNRIGGDIVFNVEESVALEGNSGPYVQYAHARARSILRKVGNIGELPSDLQADERSLARKLTEFNEVLQRASVDCMPHHICTYLYELAHAFNRFYEKNRVIDDPRQAERAALVKTYAEVLKSGLDVLGIAAPEQL
jgi:arginyl-tRNA synthetase